MGWRYGFVFSIFIVFFFLIISRLFYWQIVRAENISNLARSQYEGVVKLFPERGEIKTSDGYRIAANKVSYILHANPSLIEDTGELVSTLSDTLEVDKASISSRIEPEKVWVSIQSNISAEKKDEIQKLDLPGIGFDEKFTRLYPEASIAAHLIGFLGKDEAGEGKGYFGLEGFYDRLLKGKEGYITELRDALGKPILLKRNSDSKVSNGGDLILSIDRSIQFLVERKLKEGIEQYSAEGGMVGVMDPKTGGIISMASYPSFSPQDYWEHEEDLYINPFISKTYEPGSTLKPIIMASAIDAGVITPQTKCDICGGPVRIGEYDLKTWNDKYYKNTNMIEVIQHSDNKAWYL